MNENRRSFGKFSGEVARSLDCEFEMGRDGCFVRIRQRKINSNKETKKNDSLVWDEFLV